MSNEHGSNSDVSDGEQEPTNNGYEATEDIRILDPDTIDLDLNHGRIAKIENLREELASDETSETLGC